jgi:UDP-glucose 4-epimerase
MTRYCVAGGAGFIGSHVTARLLAGEPDCAVTVFDNFSSGRTWHLPSDPRLTVVRGDLKDQPAITAAIAGHDHVYHFASNPDIAKAVTQPDVDFWEGTYLTQNLLEAMRVAGVGRMTYVSGSGVYGDAGETLVAEDFSPMRPVSTYGASKLAGESLICAYCSLFGIKAVVFRFANVVGPHQTHGVGFDFVRRLLADPTRLRILGDGQQSKSYIHIDDIVAAMRFGPAQPGASGSLFDVFNVSTEDHLTVREIADIAVSRLGIASGRVSYEFTGGRGGWKGDVPVVRMDSRKIRTLGWRNARTATEAMRDAIDSMIADARAGRFDEAAGR